MVMKAYRAGLLNPPRLSPSSTAGSSTPLPGSTDAKTKDVGTQTLEKRMLPPPPPPTRNVAVPSARRNVILPPAPRTSDHS